MTEDQGSEPNLMGAILADMIGHLYAIETMVVNLMASHARTSPNGVFSQMIDDPEEAVRTLGNINFGAGDLEEGHLTAAKEKSLLLMLHGAKSLLHSWRQRDREGSN